MPSVPAFAEAQATSPVSSAQAVQRGDGAYFVLNNGYKYPAQLVELRDDELEAIPDGPPAASSPGPASPAHVLYEADWSTGANRWQLGTAWKIMGNQLVSDGTEGIAIAPFRPTKADYAVEAEIQMVHTGGFFGLVARRGEAGMGYLAGAENNGVSSKAIITDKFLHVEQLAAEPYDPGTEWHTYRLEARGNQLILIIDGNQYLSAVDNNYLSDRQHGLTAYDKAQVVVRSYRVIDL